MSHTLTIRDVQKADKAWLKAEAKLRKISMEELVRRIIHDTRQTNSATTRPSEIIKQVFGENHGVDLPKRGRYGLRPIDLENH